MDIINMDLQQFLRKKTLSCPNVLVFIFVLCPFGDKEKGLAKHLSHH